LSNLALFWTLSIVDLDQKTVDLSGKNPNTPEEAPLREPNEILENMAKLDKESKLVLNAIKELI
jgi:type I restriction enzyme M protein